MLGRRAYICYTRANRSAAARLHRLLSNFITSGDCESKADQEASGLVLDQQLDQTPLNKTAQFDIEASDWLILLCSPSGLTPSMEEAAMAFKAKFRAHRIIAVVTDGEPGASRLPGLAHRESLPRSLLYATDAKGALTDHPVFPFVVDLRPDGLSLADAAAEIAARVTGQPVAWFRAQFQKRRRGHGLLAGAAAAAAAAALLLAPVLHRDVQLVSRSEAALAAGGEAHKALDQGQSLTAIQTLTEVFAKDFNFAAPPFPTPHEALSAINRAALEMRELAVLPAPTTNIGRLVPSPDGAVIAIDREAGAYLVDLGAGDATQVYAPGENATNRVSANGEALWTARFGAEARNEDGELYAPLIFENVDLASGEITMTTAVQSLPPRRGSAAISSDGERFAVDLGPGHSDRTLIAVFSRTQQALVGVATLPADQAHVTFLSPDRVLLATNPPNIYGEAPGLYLWNLAEDRPRVLRAPGRAPLCPGGQGASRRAIAAEIEAGRLPAADWKISEDGAEVALLLPSLGDGSCILRWNTETGRRAPTLSTQKTYQSLAFTIAGELYAALPAEGDLALITREGEKRLPGCIGRARYFGDDSDPLILCEGLDGVTLHRGYSGQRKWRGPNLPDLTEVAYDPAARRLILASSDGRLLVWDAAARGYPVARGTGEAMLTQPDKDHVAVFVDGGSPIVFDLAGRPAELVDPALLARVQPNSQPELLALAATGEATSAETCAPLVAAEVIHRSDSPSGRRAAIETSEGMTVYDRVTCLPILRLDMRTTGSGPMLVSDDFLWAPLPGEIAVFPLNAPPAKALASLHARAVGLRTPAE